MPGELVVTTEILEIDGVAAGTLAARFGTPLYVYSARTLLDRWQSYREALAGMEHQICYAVKANSNLGLLRLLAEQGAGFDIVSGGELERVLLAGAKPGRVVFSGVGKQDWEIRRALQVGIGCFNVESEAELVQLGCIAAQEQIVAPVSIRVNPDVDAQTHPHISTGLKENKFGVPLQAAHELYQQAARLPSLRLVGVDCHIGSQLLTLDPFVDALERILHLVDRLEAEGIRLEHVDVGGGLGIAYRPGEQSPAPRHYVDRIRPLLADRKLKLICEPGRSLVADAGYLLTRVILLKPGPFKNFAVVDAAMNDLIRPALYEAWMNIEVADAIVPEVQPLLWDIVGPVCETGDFLGKDRVLSLAAGSLLVIRQAGAYGFAMSSQYNSRCRAAEVLVEDGQARLIRARERLEDLWALELLPEEHG